MSNLEQKVKEFFSHLDVWECSDAGHWFKPNYISSCRCLTIPKLEAILTDMRTLVGLPKPGDPREKERQFEEMEDENISWKGYPSISDL